MKKILFLFLILFIVSCAGKNYNPYHSDNYSGSSNAISNLTNGTKVNVDGYLLESVNKRDSYLLYSPSNKSTFVVNDANDNIKNLVNSNLSMSFQGNITSINKSEEVFIDIETIRYKSPANHYGRIMSIYEKYYFEKSLINGRKIQVFLKNSAIPKELNQKKIYSFFGTIQYDKKNNVFLMEEPIIYETDYTETVLKIYTFSHGRMVFNCSDGCNFHDVFAAGYDDSSIWRPEYLNLYYKLEYGVLISKYTGVCAQANLTDCQKITQREDKTNLLIHDPNFIVNDFLSQTITNANKPIYAAYSNGKPFPGSVNLSRVADDVDAVTGKSTKYLRVLLKKNAYTDNLNKPNYFYVNYLWTNGLSGTKLVSKCEPGKIFCQDKYETITVYAAYNILSGTPVELVSIEEVLNITQ